MTCTIPLSFTRHFPKTAGDNIKLLAHSENGNFLAYTGARSDFPNICSSPSIIFISLNSETTKIIFKTVPFIFQESSRNSYFQQYLTLLFIQFGDFHVFCTLLNIQGQDGELHVWRWTIRVINWRYRTEKRSRGRSPTRYSDDIKRHLIRTAQERIQRSNGSPSPAVDSTPGSMMITMNIEIIQ